MREVTIGGETLTIVASPITLFVYKREFGTDLIGDLREALQSNGSTLLQMTWAMAKTAATGKLFPSFADWIEKLEYVDFDDVDMYEAIAEEMTRGFFRGGGAVATQAAEADQQ